MSLIAWGPMYALGIESIDTQHKRLIKLINQCDEARRDPEHGREMLGKVLNELMDYTKTHFADEEQLMEEHGYPDYERHKEIHAELIEKLLELRAKFDEGHEGVGENLIRFLNNWLSLHILGVDKKYVPHLKENGVK